MSKKVKFEFEGKFFDDIKRLPDEIKSPIRRALKAVGYELLRKSGEEVPHDEGTLQNSGKVEDVAFNEVEVGYHTRYAARLHEHPEYRFKKGRKGKYLEDPLKQNLKEWEEILSDELRPYFK